MELTALTSAVDLSTVGPAVLTVAGSLIGVYVTILAARKVMGFVRRG